MCVSLSVIRCNSNPPHVTMSRQKEVRLRKEEENCADLKECYYYYLSLFFISLKNVLFTYLSQLHFKFISQTSKFHIV